MLLMSQFRLQLSRLPVVRDRRHCYQCECRVDLDEGINNFGPDDIECGVRILPSGLNLDLP